MDSLGIHGIAVELRDQGDGFGLATGTFCTQVSFRELKQDRLHIKSRINFRITQLSFRINLHFNGIIYSWSL